MLDFPHSIAWGQGGKVVKLLSCHCLSCPLPLYYNRHYGLLQSIVVQWLYLFLRKLSVISRSGELQTQKLKSHLVRTQCLNVLPLKPGVGQYIAIHATHTARDFLLAYFYPSGPFICIFSKTSPDFSHVECLRHINRLRKHDLWYDDLWNEYLRDRVKFVLALM